MPGKTHIILISCIITTIIVSLLSLSCNSISPEERPGSVSWIKVKTGLADSTENPADRNMTNEEYAYWLNNNGYEVSWSRVDDADYYEVRVSTNSINKKNWDKATCAATVKNKDTSTIKAIVVVKPDVSGNNCTGCKLCLPVCPRNAIQIFKGKAVIAPDSCVGCGQCYEACTYNAVTDLTLGKYYYFAVRAFTSNKIYAEDVICTYASYILRYKNVLHKPVTPDSTTRWCQWCGWSGCFIINLSGRFIELGGCPVNAIYSDSMSYIHIDQSKCIYCGLCVPECGFNRGEWSTRREVRSSEWPIESE